MSLVSFLVTNIMCTSKKAIGAMTQKSQIAAEGLGTEQQIFSTPLSSLSSKPLPCMQILLEKGYFHLRSRFSVYLF